MDKWKDLELEKMSVGGNRRAKEFFESQPDYRSSWTLQEKYDSRAAALLRDKVATEAAGKCWSEDQSSARNYRPTLTHVATTNDLIGSAANPNRDAWSKQSSSAFYGGGSLHTCNSDLEGWLRTSNDAPSSPANDWRSAQSSDPYSLDHMKSWQGFGSEPTFNSNSGPSWQSGWAMVSQFAAAAAKRTTDLASQAGQKTRQITQSVQEKVKDAHLLDTLSKGVDTVTTKLQNVRVHGMRSIEGYLTSSEPSDSQVAPSPCAKSVSQNDDDDCLIGSTAYDHGKTSYGSTSQHPVNGSQLDRKPDASRVGYNSGSSWFSPEETNTDDNKDEGWAAEDWSTPSNNVDWASSNWSTSDERPPSQAASRRVGLTASRSRKNS